MAKCTISSVTLISPGAEGRENIGLTTAKVTASCSASLPGAHVENVSDGGDVSWGPWYTTGSETGLDGKETIYFSRTGTQSRTRDWISYKDLNYKWTPLPSGNVVNKGSATEELHWTSLTRKSQNAISTQVEVTCTTVTWPQKQSRNVTQKNYEIWENHERVEDYYYDPSYDSWPSTWSDNGSSTETKPTCSETATSESINIWTRPGLFTDFNFSQDTIIQSSAGLTAEKVDNWINHCNAYAHWYNQNNTNVTSVACKVSTNDLITADWYNACVDACVDPLTKPSYVTGGPNGTIITTEIFAALSAAISKDDS